MITKPVPFAQLTEGQQAEARAEVEKNINRISRGFWPNDSSMQLAPEACAFDVTPDGHIAEHGCYSLKRAQ